MPDMNMTNARNRIFMFKNEKVDRKISFKKNFYQYSEQM